MSVKRYAIAAGAAALVFSGVYGAAAALAVDGGAIQTGSDTTLTCDTDGVKVASYRADVERPAVSNGVRVEQVSANCEGLTLFATVFTADGTQLSRGSAVIGTNGIVNADFPTPVDAASIEQIDITIE